MKRCAFLTLVDAAGYVIDDELAYDPLRALGWRVEAVPWQQPGVSWGGFDAVVIRSPWDYQKDPLAFLAMLEEVERSGVPLFNGLDLVRWNLPKLYLRELASRGVPTVPTVWRDRLGTGDLVRVFEVVEADEVVLKPVVGANADGAFRLDRCAGRERVSAVERYYARRPFMVQPFVHAVLEEGEYSLIYFDGEYSHGVLKAPMAADFRVQEEHGGHIRSVEADGALLAAGNAVLEALGELPLYARVDLVRSNEGSGFWLMELELIEPSLYLRLEPEAPGRFARALHRRVAMGTDPSPAV